MPQPVISIVTPSFNQADYIEDTLKSVLDQDYPALEYVVIDGGSTDGSVDIIKKYEDRLKYWVSEPDKGHGDALNKGFAQTTGEIMAWINSDDKYYPWAFEIVAEVFEQHPDVNWITGMNTLWDKKGRNTNVWINPKNIYDFLRGEYKYIQQESVFWRRSLWEKTGGYINEDYQLMVDGELWTRFFLHDRLHSVRSILGGFRVHDSNRGVQNKKECEREMQKAVETMRQNCDKKTIDTARSLEEVFNLATNPNANRQITHATRDRYTRACREAAYDLLVSDNHGNWKKLKNAWLGCPEETAN